MPSHRRLAEQLARTWRRAAGGDFPVVELLGGDPRGKRALAAAACARLGVGLQAMAAESLPAAAADLDALLRLWHRESLLSRSVLYLAADDLRPEDPQEAALRRFVDQSRSALVVSRQRRLPPRHRPLLSLHVERPDAEEQRGVWRRSLARLHAAALGGDAVGRAPSVVTRTSVTRWPVPPRSRAARRRTAAGEPGGARGTGRGAGRGAGRRLRPQRLGDPRCLRRGARPARRRRPGGDGPRGDGDGASAAEAGADDAQDGDLAAALWHTCRVRARPALEDLAQRIDGRAGWDDLVLPAAQRRTLAEIVAHVRHRAQVYDDWGFGAKSARGLGVTALFAGASGTGKTMAAEVLARELGLDLYRIDLSAVVSKYIGETEKNLRRIFDAAEAGGAILLFDEADALFGKRTEVKDSHDRYANIEVSYLLQRMESYRGLAILTTNLQGRPRRRLPPPPALHRPVPVPRRRAAREHLARRLPAGDAGRRPRLSTASPTSTSPAATSATSPSTPPSSPPTPAAR